MNEVTETHYCAECGYRFGGMPAGDLACPDCGCEERLCVRAEAGPTLTDTETGKAHARVTFNGQVHGL